MAQADLDKKRYQNTGVNGSLAYEVTQPAEEEYFYSVDRNDLPDAPQPNEAVVTRPAPAPRQAIAPAAIVGAMAAIALVVVLMFQYVQMSIATKEVLELENQIKVLEQQRADLQIGYETAFNLTEIEDYAINELGMQKPRSDQIYYVNSTAEDRAVILDDSAEHLTWADRFGDFLCAIAEYFS